MPNLIHSALKGADCTAQANGSQALTQEQRPYSKPRQRSNPLAHGEPAVGKGRHRKFVSPVRGDVWVSESACGARRPKANRISPLAGLKTLYHPALSHGWLIVGYMTAPASRAFRDL